MIKIKNTNLPVSMQIVLFILALFLFYLLLEPLLNVFLASIILTYVFYPVYKIIKKTLKLESVSVILTLILAVLLFLVPFVFIASQVPSQSSKIYEYTKNNFDFSDINPQCIGSATTLCKIMNFASEKFELDKVIGLVFDKITSIATYIVVRIPNIIVGIFLALFISFFLFKDGKTLLNRIIDLLPLNKKSTDRLVNNFGSVTHSVVYAHIIVAIAQGILGAIGFYVFGLESAIFWGIVMSVFALLPIIGPAIIWLPTSLFMIINGITGDSYADIGKGIGLLLYGIIIISTSDNLLRIKIIGDQGGIHPLTVLLGIIGGISLFGMIGIFVGPIALSLLITYFKDFKENYF
jgi:predicted PurR-regulated permease PerM